MPAAQAAHCGDAVEVPAAVCSLPAGQASQAVQLVWFAVDEYVPEPQVVHWRLAVALGGVLTNEPALQSLHPVHESELTSVLYSPLAQVEQVRSVVVVPLAVTNVPAAQLVQATHAVAALPSWSQVVAAHGCFGVAPPGQWKPAAQLAHCGGDVAVPGAVCSWPAGQASAGRHVDWFGAEVNVPPPHVVHCRSLDDVPGVLMNVPAAQSRHGAQVSAFDVVLNVALVHVEQIRLAVVDPLDSTRSPATQLVFATHAVAALPS